MTRKVLLLSFMTTCVAPGGFAIDPFDDLVNHSVRRDSAQKEQDQSPRNTQDDLGRHILFALSCSMAFRAPDEVVISDPPRVLGSFADYQPICVARLPRHLDRPPKA